MFTRNPLKGMDDVFPSDMRVIKYLTNKLKEISELYTYQEYDTPLLEPIEIYEAKTSSELVNEQSFIVEKKEGERLILRPEITPTLARMVAQKEQELKKPIRWYSIPKCYRYEQPQKGRRREFLQYNIDILGEDTLYAELEVFHIIVDILTNFGATYEQFQIFFNNRRFIDAVCEFILDIPEEKFQTVYDVLDKSDKMEEEEFEAYVREAFQNEFIVQSIYKLRDSDDLDELLKSFNDIPDTFYESQGYKELKNLENLIQNSEIDMYCSFSSGIVRGLDYYTGTVFEVFDTGKENIRAIFGGGRYDDLLSIFSDKQLSGIGFGMGMLMLELFLRTYDLIPEDIEDLDYSDVIYITTINKKVASYVFNLAQRIREQKISCLIDYRFDNLGNQLSKANDLGVNISLIIGPNEMEKNQVTVKNMISEDQKTVSFENLLEEISKMKKELKL
ncbi:MAG: histidine--tRNA ligase [Promethearchaeota archaeon]|nr:MAG: histidine--tRNA ligase [Candidatus Lokiarchaeota archaeon]